MKRNLIVGLAVVFALVAATASFAASTGTMKVKVGESIWVCGCGESCPCMSMANTKGVCACGKDLVQGKVTKVGKGTATVLVNGKEQVFKTTGKYMCGCGPSCKCGTISQTPGKCACGKDLVPVKAAKKAAKQS